MSTVTATAGTDALSAPALSAARERLRRALGPTLGPGLVAATLPLPGLGDEGLVVDDRVRDLAWVPGRIETLAREALPDLDASTVDTLRRCLHDSPDRIALAALVLRALSPLDALRLQPLGQLFSETQAVALNALMQAPRGPVRSMAVTGILKVTRRCNLRCTYCHDWRAGADAAMPFDVRLAALRWLLAGSAARDVRVLLHGGEPSLIGERVLLQMLTVLAHLRLDGQRVQMHLQSNGTHLPKPMLHVLRQFDIKVSVSLDGPPQVHDTTRRDLKGRPTSERVLAGLRQLQDLQLLSGVVIVASPALVQAGAETLVRFLLDEGLSHVAVLPMRPAASADRATPRTDEGGSLDTPTYLRFLADIGRARRRLAPWLEVRELDALLRARRGEAGGTCELQGQCVGGYFGIEPDGTVMHCDKYLGDERYSLGHVREDFEAVARGPRACEVAERAQARHARMGGCRWHGRCRGWCPHEDYVQQQAGEPAPACCGLAPWFEGLPGEIAHDD